MKRTLPILLSFVLSALLPCLAQDAGGRFDALVRSWDGTGDAWKEANEGTWPLRGEPAAVGLRTELRAILDRLEAIDARNLETDKRIDREILRALVEYRLAEVGWILGDPVFPLRALEDAAGTLSGRDVGRILDLYGRLRQLPVRILERRQELDPLDRPSVEAAIERIDALRRVLADQGPAAEARLDEFGDLPARARAGADLALDLYRRELARRSSEEPPRGPGVGRERFLARLRLYHRIDQPIDEIVATAERVFAETERLLEETARQIDPALTWRQVAEDMKSAGPGEDELVEYCRRTMAESIEFLRAKGFMPLPDFALDCGVKGHATKGHFPYAYYRPPREDDLRGEFVVTTVGDWMTDAQRLQKTRDSNRYWMRVVTIHESFPGHHLQFAFARRAQTPLRRRYYTPFFSEGWGLYCEELMYRHGFLADDPRTRIAQLRMRLWRCARVLCDVGLHTGTMTPDEAVRLLVDRCLLEPDSARKEVDRYLGAPTQPMSYLVGWLEIERLREAYRQRHAAADPAWEHDFHAMLLAHGSVPLSALGDGDR